MSTPFLKIFKKRREERLGALPARRLLQFCIAEAAAVHAADLANQGG